MGDEHEGEAERVLRSIDGTLRSTRTLLLFWTVVAFLGILLTVLVLVAAAGETAQ
jgi:hypothetical protein